MKLVLGDAQELLRSATGEDASKSLARPLVEWEPDTRTARFLQHVSRPLNGAEREKMSAFRFGRDSLLYALTHALVRHELSKECGSTSPEAWLFRTNVYGKPYTANSSERIWFSLSHSWPYFAVLVSRKGRCGVDIERADAAMPYDAIARQALQAHEYDDMRQGPHPYGRFLRFWTVKEAACKAIGCGMPLGFPLLSLCNDFRDVYFHGRKITMRIAASADTNDAYAVAACCLCRTQCACSTRIAGLEDVMPLNGVTEKSFESSNHYHAVA